MLYHFQEDYGLGTTRAEDSTDRHHCVRFFHWLPSDEFL